jgi:hypothetical protein
LCSVRATRESHRASSRRDVLGSRTWGLRLSHRHPKGCIGWQPRSRSHRTLTSWTSSALATSTTTPGTAKSAGLPIVPTSGNGDRSGAKPLAHAGTEDGWTHIGVQIGMTYEYNETFARARPFCPGLLLVQPGTAGRHGLGDGVRPSGSTRPRAPGAARASPSLHPFASHAGRASPRGGIK